jgi:hypothetical protein
VNLLDEAPESMFDEYIFKTFFFCEKPKNKIGAVEFL